MKSTTVENDMRTFIWYENVERFNCIWQSMEPMGIDKLFRATQIDWYMHVPGITIFYTMGLTYCIVHWEVSAEVNVHFF